MTRTVLIAILFCGCDILLPETDAPDAAPMAQEATEPDAGIPVVEPEAPSLDAGVAPDAGQACECWSSLPECPSRTWPAGCPTFEEYCKAPVPSARAERCGS